ncbi:MAG TPA: DNA recombination protein RmuC, partial [Ruminiclostridium sp.]|nr:DNA recombination protein RmuC [Ruminiclostridium sp.]
MDYILLFITVVLSFIALIISIVNIIATKHGASVGNQKDIIRRIEEIRRDMLDDLRQSRTESLQMTQNTIKSMSDILSSGIARTAAAQDTRLAELNSQLSVRQETLQKTVSDMMKRVDSQLYNSMSRGEQKMEAIRVTVEERLSALQAESSKKLDEMRSTVDEKLEKTLQERIGQSFKLVSDRLEQVYKGLGEMQTLASGVGDLKKVLSNVKTRGVLGEIQLGAILEEILSPEQYKANVATKKGSSCVVEYAVKLPGTED